MPLYRSPIRSLRYALMFALTIGACGDDDRTAADAALDSAPDANFGLDGATDVALDSGGEADSAPPDSNVPPPPSCTGMTWTGDYNGDGEELAGYEHVIGDILIADSDLASLHHLGCLRSVDGDLWIAGRSLPSLEGLSQLRSVSGVFRIANAQSLVSIGALSALTSVRQLGIDSTGITTLDGLESLRSIGSLSLSNNPQLIDIAALSGLAELPDGLDITGNARLSQLVGLGSCTRVAGGGLNIGGNALTHLDELSSLVEVSSLSLFNEALRSLEGLSGITRVPGRVSFSDTSLVDLHGLRLTEAGELIIDSNVDLMTLRGLETLQAVSEGVFVQRNESLMDIGALSSLRESGGIYFEENNTLRNLSGLSGLSTIEGNLVVLDHALLNDIGGLVNVTSVSGHLRIERNHSLMALGLDSLTTVSDYVTITGEALATLEGLAALTSVGSLSVAGTAIQNLAGLERLTNVGGLSFRLNPQLSDLSALQLSEADSLALTDNPALVSLTGLEELEELRFRLSIERNRDLASLDGLDELMRVGDLNVQGNVSLTDIRALRSLTHVERSFLWRNNTMLCRSSILSLLSAINAVMDPDLLVPPANIMGNRGC